MTGSEVRFTICVSGECRITIGIRPEHIRIGLEQTPMSTQGRIGRKSIVVGGQYLLVIKVGDLLLKAKVNSVLDHRVQDEVWVECPLERIAVFGPNGHRLDGTLSVPGARAVSL